MPLTLLIVGLIPARANILLVAIDVAEKYVTEKMSISDI
jgi:hypothetical protein